METKVSFVLVGAFVILLGTALVAGALWLASGGNLQKRYDLYHAIENESVAGLNINAPVKYNGVDVGKVQQIHLDPADPERVILLLAIEHGTPIKEDTVAVLKTQGLTGIAYLELSGSARDAPPLRVTAGNQYPVIRTKPSLIARLDTVLTDVLGKLDNTTGNLNAILSDGNRTAISSALTDIARITHTIAARQATIDRGIVDAGSTLQNTARLSSRAGPLLDQIGRAADEVGKMGIAVTRTSVSTGNTVDSVGGEVQRFAAETLPALERLLGELSALTNSLHDLSEETNRDPGRLLFGRSPAPDGPGETSSKGLQP